MVRLVSFVLVLTAVVGGWKHWAASAAESGLPGSIAEHFDGDGTDIELDDTGLPSAGRMAPNAPPPAPRKFNPRMLRLRERVRSAIALYRPRLLNTRDHSPWEVMHSFVGYGVNTELRRGGPKGQPVNSIGWLCWGGHCRGEPMVVATRQGIEARIGPGLQGHAGQFLAIMAQSKVRAEYEMRVDGRKFTVADLIETEKRTCRTNSELTFKLISMVHYLDLDDTWTADDGQQWSIPRLIQEEIRQPIRGAACGGTHRLFGLSYAFHKRVKRGQPLDGQYERARKFIRDYHRYAFGTLQNRDGSFSTAWFARAEARADLDRRLQTSGHILEWLAFSLPVSELESPHMIRAVEYLSGILLEHPNRDWSVGPLGHAIHALQIYNERAFREVPLTPFMATRPDAPKPPVSPLEPKSPTATKPDPMPAVKEELAEPELILP